MKIATKFGLSDRFQLLSSTFVAQALRILTTIVMARWLSPKDYGLVTITSAIPGIVSCLGDFGAMRCLVQIRDLPDREVRETALTLSFGLSFLYAATAIGCGVFLSSAYNDQRLVGIATIQGITGILSMLYSYQLANLSRDLMFTKESKQNLLFAGSQAFSGIAFATLGLGVFALVLQALVGQLVANLMIARQVTLKWPTHFSRRTFLRYWKLGWRITFAQYLNNIQGSLTNITVGLVAGPVALGQFGRACQIRELVGQNILNSFDRLLFALFADAQHDLVRLRHQFLRGCTAINLVSSLGGILLCVSGRDVIRLLLGPQWETAGHLLQILSFGLFFNGISLPAIVLVQALGKPLVWVRYSAINLLLLFGVLIIGRLYGMEGLCLGLVFSQIIFSLSFFAWQARDLAIGWREAARPVCTVWAGALAGLGVGFTCGPKLSLYHLPIVNICFLVVLDTIAFFITIWLLDPRLLPGMMRLITNKRPSASV